MRFSQLALLTASFFMVTVELARAQGAPPPAQPQAPIPAPAADVPPPPPPAQAVPAQPAPADPAAPAPDAAQIPPPPPSYESPPLTPGADAGSCVPACREGFLCHEGQCISACNPPCAAGQRCTAQGQCVADPNAAPLFAQAEPAPAPLPEGFEQHDGFMLRATIGFGGGTVTREGGGSFYIADESKFSGAGLLWSLDVGGSPVDNLVVHGRIAQFAIGNPDVTLDGDDEGTIEELSVGAVVIGPAVSYYFMPVNIYATAAVGLGVIVITHEDDEDAEATSDAGLGLNVDVGKEWWVNANWGLGVAGRFWYTSAQDEEANDAEFKCIGGGVVFSATYQ